LPINHSCTTPPSAFPFSTRSVTPPVAIPEKIP
jgi:hypothetical protein